MNNMKQSLFISFHLYGHIVPEVQLLLACVDDKGKPE